MARHKGADQLWWNFDVLRRKEELTVYYKDIPISRSWGAEEGQLPHQALIRILPPKAIQMLEQPLCGSHCPERAVALGCGRHQPLPFHWLTDITTQAPENKWNTVSKKIQIQHSCTKGNSFPFHERIVWKRKHEQQTVKQCKQWRLTWRGGPLYCTYICIQLWCSALSFHTALLFNRQRLSNFE